MTSLRPLVVSLSIAAVPFVFGGACRTTTDGTSSSSSSGSAQQTPNVSSYLEFCRQAFIAPFCQQPPCDLGGTFNAQDCLTRGEAWCAEFQAQLEPRLASGRAHFNPELTGECIDVYKEFYRIYADYQCHVPGSVAQYYGFFGITAGSSAAPNCSNGRLVAGAASGSSSMDRFSKCNNIIKGTVALGASCEDAVYCASGNCAGRPDGGCGICADGGPGNSQPSTPLNEGDTCVRRYDGGFSTSACKEGLACDSADTDTCLPVVGATEACGPGFKLCEGTCGYQCNGSDGGRGTCVPRPANNERCGYAADFSGYTLCQRGLSCALGLLNGTPDYFSATCKPHATGGQPCSPGFNYDAYQSEYTGGFSYGTKPVCAVGLECQVPDGGVDGTCAAAPTECTDFLSACADPSKICRRVNGTARCLAPAAQGEECTYGNDCASNLRCFESDGGPGRCGAPLAEGAACGNGNETCQVQLSCTDGQCTDALETTGTLAMCQ